MVICAYDADGVCQMAAYHRRCYHVAVKLCIANYYHRAELFYTLFILCLDILCRFGGACVRAYGCLYTCFCVLARATSFVVSLDCSFSIFEYVLLFVMS